jgi:hypothetical protein
MTTLALYTPHNVLWFLPVTFVGVLFFAIGTVLRNKKIRMVPSWMLYGAWSLAAGGIVGMIGMKNYDTGRLREELRSVKPAEATNVLVVRGAVRREVTDAAAAVKILSLLGGVKNVAAHHSHPQDSVEVLFEFRGESWHYRVGRDSDLPLEFWVFNLNPACTRFGEMEIGRLETGEWEKAIGAIMDPAGK